MKAAGETYLPRLAGQGISTIQFEGIVGSWQVDEYEAYKTRANFENMVAPSVRGLLGALFRKPPVIEVPRLMQVQLDDITLDGESAASFMQRSAQEVLSVGYHGVLVDLPVDQPSARPYWVPYRAEQILYPRTSMRDGVRVLSHVRLEETHDVAGDDEFVDDEELQYRVLELDTAGYYLVRLFQREDERKDPIEVESYYPTIRGERLRWIPFVFFGPSGLTPIPEKPPLLDLVEINLSHYRTSADLEEGRHKLAVPTPYAAGVDDQDMVLRLGANVAYKFQNPQAKMAFMEFSGAGLSELRLALEEKQAQASALGARLLEPPKAGVESAEAIRLRTSGEQNFLMTLAGTLSQGFTQVLRYHAWWMSLEAKSCTVTVNNDFLDTRLSPDERKQLMAEVKERLISRRTYFYQMAKGEIYPPETTQEKEDALIEAEAPLAGEIDIPPDDEQEDEEAA